MAGGGPSSGVGGVTKLSTYPTAVKSLKVIDDSGPSSPHQYQPYEAASAGLALHPANAPSAFNPVRNHYNAQQFPAAVTSSALPQPPHQYYRQVDPYQYQARPHTQSSHSHQQQPAYRHSPTGGAYSGSSSSMYSHSRHPSAVSSSQSVSYGSLSSAHQNYEYDRYAVRDQSFSTRDTRYDGYGTSYDYDLPAAPAYTHTRTPASSYSQNYGYASAQHTAYSHRERSSSHDHRQYSGSAGESGRNPTLHGQYSEDLYSQPQDRYYPSKNYRTSGVDTRNVGSGMAIAPSLRSASSHLPIAPSLYQNPEDVCYGKLLSNGLFEDDNMTNTGDSILDPPSASSGAISGGGTLPSSSGASYYSLYN
jgi:hypothetical protein